MKASINILLPFIALSILTQFACTKDKSKVVCASGYEGADCKTQSREKFSRNWSQNGSASRTLPAQFAVSVANGDEITSVVIQNFDNISQHVRATVSSGDSLIIPLQSVAGKTVAGYCHYMSEHNVVVHYDITDVTTGVVSNINTEWH